MDTRLKYAVGDRVKINESYPEWQFRDKEGTISGVSNYKDHCWPYKVEFAEDIDGFNSLSCVAESELTAP